MKSVLRILAGLALLGTALFVPSSSAAPKQPNIVLIMADDMGFSDPGCYGSEIATPNLDKLAAQGLRFTSFYNTARCWPTRSALLSGYYPQQIRADPQQGLLPEWALLLPRYLKPLGYRSYHSGKWHINGAPQCIADGGFDHSYRVDDHNNNFNPAKLTEDDQRLPAVPPNSGYYTTTAYADFAIRCLKEHAAKYASAPFFTYIAFTTPHFPLQAPPQDIAKYRDKYLAGWEVVRAERYRRQKEMGIVECGLSAPEPGLRAPSGKLGVEKEIGPGEVVYALPWGSLNEEQRRFQATKMAIHAAMVDRIDQEVGRVIEQVKAMGVFDDTIILFLSDNGASAEVMVRGGGNAPNAVPGSADSFLCLGPGWSTMCNTPYRRHKIWVHEGGISTPLIVHWPHGIAAQGELRHDMGHVIDMVPTLLEVAGAKPAPQPAGAPPFPGRSLVPAFAKDHTVTRDFIFFDHSGNRALREGDWKLVSAKDNSDQWELYNLKTDRQESTGLAAKYPDRVKEMAGRWEQLEQQFRQQAGVNNNGKATKKKGGKKKE